MKLPTIPDSFLTISHGYIDKMVITKIVALVIIIYFTKGQKIVEETLINDFFVDKKVQLTIATCWTKGKNFICSNSKQFFKYPSWDFGTQKLE